MIVPHGVLHYLPFHALYDGAGYLIDSVHDFLRAQRQHFRSLPA